MLAFLLLLQRAICDEFKNATCYYTSTGVVLTQGIDKDHGHTWAYWSDTMNTTGTSHIVIESTKNSSVPSASKLYCAGYLDGYLMQDRIFNRFNLQKDILNIPRETPFSKVWTDWLQKNIDFSYNSVESNPEDPYWKSIGLILRQFDGLVAGYNSAAPEGKKLTAMDFWIINSVGDIYDLSALWEPKSKRDPISYMECSALVKLLDDYSDIYFSHDTWSDYRKMSNTVKEYIFYVPEWSASRVTVSTKIGAIPSSEDFWITSNGLMIFETTNGNTNKTMVNEYSVETLLAWIRNTHASWTANTGEQWADNFFKLNSGTYNNQYVIVDSKVFTPGTKPEKDLIWVAETMPLLTHKGDLTKQLVDDGYFPSFNTPFFRDIYEKANYSNPANMTEYYTNPRYLIFKRDAPKVNDLDSFKHLLRQNNYETDEISNDPGLQILARYDLRAKNPRSFGGLDTKVTTALWTLDNMKFEGIWSPEHETHDAWDFESDLNKEKFPTTLQHDGFPAKWDFNWSTFDGFEYSRCGAAKKRSQCFEIKFCGWCTYDAKCYMGYKEGPANTKCQAGWRVPEVEKPWATAVIVSVTVLSFAFCGVIFGYNLYDWQKKKKNGQVNYSQI